MSDSEEDVDLKAKNQIRIDIQFGDAMPVQFIVKPATKFAKLVKLFTSQSGVEKDAYQYRYDGNRMNPNGIPDISMQQCGFEVGKVYLIEAFNEQLGGFWAI